MDSVLEGTKASRNHSWKAPGGLRVIALHFHLQPQGTWGAWGTGVFHALGVPGYPWAILRRKEENLKKISISVEKTKQEKRPSTVPGWAEKSSQRCPMPSLDGPGPGSLNGPRQE